MGTDTGPDSEDAKGGPEDDPAEGDDPYGGQRLGAKKEKYSGADAGTEEHHISQKPEITCAPVEPIRGK